LAAGRNPVFGNRQEVMGSSRRILGASDCASLDCRDSAVWANVGLVARTAVGEAIERPARRAGEPGAVFETKWVAP
jgi:hypothetical protein